MDEGETGQEAEGYNSKPAFSWSFPGRERNRKKDIDPQEFEEYRALVISLPLIRNRELDPEDWRNHKKNTETVAQNIHLLDQAFQNPEYQTDALRMMDCLTELLIFDDGKAFSNKLADIYRKHFGQLESVMQHGSQEQKTVALKIAARFALWKERRGGFPISNHREMQFLKKHSEEIRQGFERSLKPDNSDYFGEYLEPLVVLLESGNQTESTLAKEALLRSLYNPHYNPEMLSPEYRFGFVAKAIGRGLWDKKYTKFNEILTNAMVGYGIDFDDYQIAHMGKRKLNSLRFGYRFAYQTANELVQFGQMETERPGIIRFYSSALKDQKYLYSVSSTSFIEHFDATVNDGDPFARDVEKVANLLQWDIETAKRFVNVWTQNRTINILRSMEFLEKNLSAVLELEAEVPGITQTLNREFNIYDFGRYPKQLMIDQYEQRNRRDTPYGVVIYPLADWNGAFYQDKELLEKFAAQLGDKYALRVMEVGNVSGLVRGLIRLNGRYYADKNGANGPGNKIAFAILGGHGEKDAIEFGQSEYDGKLYKKYLLGTGAPKIREFFEKHPYLILNSCSTGKRGGIAQILSRALDANLISTDIPTGLASLDAIVDENGPLRIEAEYKHKNTKKTYFAGKESTH